MVVLNSTGGAIYADIHSLFTNTRGTGRPIFPYRCSTLRLPTQGRARCWVWCGTGKRCLVDDGGCRVPFQCRWWPFPFWTSVAGGTGLLSSCQFSFRIPIGKVTFCLECYRFPVLLSMEKVLCPWKEFPFWWIRPSPFFIWRCAPCESWPSTDWNWRVFVIYTAARTHTERTRTLSSPGRVALPDILDLWYGPKLQAADNDMRNMTSYFLQISQRIFDGFKCGSDRSNPYPTGCFMY